MIRAPNSGAGSLVRRSTTISTPEEQASSAHVANAGEALLQRPQSRLEPRAGDVRAARETLPLNDLENLGPTAAGAEKRQNRTYAASTSPDGGMLRNRLPNFSVRTLSR